MHAFKLKEGFEDFSGGTVKVSMSGYALDVKDALDKGNGMVIVDDDNVAAVLANYEPLERVVGEEVPEGAIPVVVPGTAAAVGELAGAPPWIPQEPSLAPSTVLAPGPMPSSDVTMEATGQVAAEHADEPGTPEEAVAAGEAVSGSSSRAGRGSSKGNSSSTSDESSEAKE